MKEGVWAAKKYSKIRNCDTHIRPGILKSELDQGTVMVNNYVVD